MKKKILTLIVLVLTICIALPGCTNMDDDYENKIKTDVYANYEMLKSDLAGMKSENEIINYLSKWAKSKNIFSDEIKNCGLVMSKEATDTYKKSESVTLQCRVDTTNMSDTMKTAAIAMTTLADTKNHGNIKLLFTKGSEGATNLPDKYLETDNFINLTERSGPRLFTGGAAIAQYQVSKNMSSKSPTGTKAYKISITGCIGGDSADRERRHPNPIVEIGKTLNECRDSGIIMEIASFNGGENSWTYPTKANAVVVVTAGEEEKFLAKLENARTDYKDKFLKTESDMEYEITETRLPAQVLSDQDTSSILNLMYTMDDGVYATSEDDGKGDILALVNTGTITTANNKLDIEIYARSIDSDLFKEMTKSYNNASGLSDASFKVTSSYPIWPQKENNELAGSIIVAAKQANIEYTPSSTFMQNDASVFYSANNDLNIVSLGIDIQDAFELTKTLVVYLESLGDSSTNTIG